MLVAALALVHPAAPASSARGDALEVERVIVTLEGHADLSSAARAPTIARARVVASTLRARASVAQRSVRGLLAVRRAEGAVLDVDSLWIVNALAVTATLEVVAELREHPDVASVEAETVIRAPPRLAVGASPEANLGVVNAPALWALGFDGAGAVVAVVDTGVELEHPDLHSRWRSGEGGWFDPNGEHVLPADRNGHGTAVASVAVGGNAGGTDIGVAPGAQWIAAKIFDDRGVATSSDIHAAFQWLLDPDGDSATDDVPDVVNASWTLGAPGCDLEFEPDLAALRAAGIVTVFAAGNSGPAVGTSLSPANNPSALAVGASDIADGLWTQSSRGPGACGATRPFPDVVSPGVQIRGADLFGAYRASTGTSLAAPHVAGALALLSSAVPDSSAVDAASALVESARDLGPSGPDDAFGNGRIDLLAAYTMLEPPLELRALRVKASNGRVRVSVRHVGCDPCRARVRILVRGTWRRLVLATVGDSSTGVFRRVPPRRWLYVVTLHDLDSGDVTSSGLRRVSLR